MRVGVQLPEVERVVRWDELVAMAREAEAVGFDSLWYGDHLLYRDGPEPTGPWEAWTTLAGLAEATERIALGPLVAATAFHSPAMLAKMAATVDEISDGRLILGIGAGWNDVEFGAFGFPLDHRFSRFAEAFEIIRRLLAGEEVTFHGDYQVLERCVLRPHPRPGGPPLMVGSTGPRVLRETLPHVWGWNAWFRHFDNDPSRLPPLLERLDAACREVGRDPQTLERSVALLLQTGDRPLRRNTQNAITGSRRRMAEAVAAVAEHGIDHVQLVLDPITLESIEEAAEVVALVR